MTRQFTGEHNGIEWCVRETDAGWVAELYCENNGDWIPLTKEPFSDEIVAKVYAIDSIDKMFSVKSIKEKIG